MTSPPRIPQPIIQGMPRENVRFFQDLVNRVQKLETSGTVPLDAIDPTPAVSGGAIADIVASTTQATGTPQTVTVPDASGDAPTSTTFHGDGVTVDFSLPVPWAAIDDPEVLDVYLDGIAQRSDEYTIAAGTLSFDVAPPYAPPAGDPNIFVKWRPDASEIATLANANKAAINHNATVLSDTQEAVNDNAGILTKVITAFNSLLAALRKGGSLS